MAGVRGWVIAMAFVWSNHAKPIQQFLVPEFSLDFYVFHRCLMVKALFSPESLFEDEEEEEEEVGR